MLVTLVVAEMLVEPVLVPVDVAELVPLVVAEVRVVAVLVALEVTDVLVVPVLVPVENIVLVGLYVAEVLSVAVLARRASRRRAHCDPNPSTLNFPLYLNPFPSTPIQSSTAFCAALRSSIHFNVCSKFSTSFSASAERSTAVTLTHVRLPGCRSTR